ncbi:DUF3160 domain-containing protein [Butyrivibrio sp. VCB2006]|uniref:DUF3160 domain-containing protein n=1 Tax=Butyrivibrio sp. VCB2006 TaxID=1280679 RepID=UPI0004107B84|nr:DUF3160 domain-containing protein [Butyrivibrio sp. VCB2006]
MKRRVLAAILTMAMLTGCSSVGNVPTENGADVTNDAPSAEQTEQSQETADTNSNTKVVPLSTKGSLLGSEETIYYDPNLVPSIPSYTVEQDLSNVVINPYLEYKFDPENDNQYNNPQKNKELLSKNGFFVDPKSGNEFFDVYEGNRYGQIPNFVTVDSLMHTYHLYFAYLMRTSEKSYLAGELTRLSAAMLEVSEKQFDELAGTDWDNAARRNVALFYIGNLLLGEKPEMPTALADNEEIIKSEYNKVMEAAGIDTCALTGLMEDYTQYKVRGYYEGDEQLEQYFRAMMWYGRIPYDLENEDMVRSAILQTLAINPNQDKWDGIYKITSFFAGASDDPGYVELSGLVTDAYGQLPELASLSADTASFDKVMAAAKKLKMPEINSIPVMEGEDPIIPSYRFMGQRFTIDAAIMQRLIYSAVKENPDGDRRYLPDALDTPAALGSEVAMEILEEKGATEFENYTDNMTIVSQHFNNDDPAFWNASLYAGWLNTLRPLLEQKGEGYPTYMQNKEWTKKNLETFAGSYVELKHDTVLYAKQAMAEMGGGDEEVLDDRGYVDPQPVIYSRFKFLSEKTKEGLEGYGMLSDESKENLDKLAEISGTLLTISEKELRNEALSDDDYEFIRCYGGYIEHFWREVNKDDEDGSPVHSDQAPSAVVTDIATDPNGTVLEVATGTVDAVYVVFPIDGELHLGVGSVYSFYQFEENIDNRLTDSQWLDMLKGGYIDTDNDWTWVEVENPYERADWTTSYRVGK